MGLLNFVDNVLTFILSKDKGGQKRYIENHPEIKQHKKELKRRIKAANAAWEKVDVDKMNFK
jgi:hypothetical protein